MKKILIVCLLFLTFTCNKENVSADVPKPVEKEINKFSENSACDDAHVDEYSFQDKTVYVFDEGTCGADMMSSVMDSDGKTIGSLGGITGNTTVNGEQFDSAIFKRTVWKKNS
jgi:hypothetical protein